MEEDSKPELASHSRIPKGLRVSKIGEERVRLEEEKQQELKRYQQAELDLDKETEYGQIINMVKSDLKQIYGDAGVILEDGDFPEVRLVPREKIVSVSTDGKLTKTRKRGYYNVNTNNLFVFVGDSLLEDIKWIHHEFHHSIGRSVRVVHPEHSFPAQGGHITQSLKHLRGEVVEEGVVEYFSREFVTFSEDPVVIKAREGFINYWTQTMHPNDLQFIQEITSDPSSQKNIILSVGLMNASTEPYNESYNLIWSAIHTPTSVEVYTMIKNGLIETRVGKSSRKRFITVIDSVFGKGTGRRLYRLSMDDPEGIRAMTEKLKRTEE